MEMTLFGIVLHEADVALTDWLLAAECLLFAWLLLRSKASLLRTLCMALFVSLAAASLLGGAYHGFFPLRTASPGGWWVWIGTMLSIGITSALLLILSAHLWKPAWTKPAFWLGAVLLAVYSYWIAAVNHEFLIAIVFYVPMLLLFLVSLVARSLRQNDLSVIPGIASVALMLLAAWAQQARIGLHPVYFNYNALYHVLQGIALLLLFLTLRKQSRAE